MMDSSPLGMAAVSVYRTTLDVVKRRTFKKGFPPRRVITVSVCSVTLVVGTKTACSATRSSKHGEINNHSTDTYSYSDTGSLISHLESIKEMITHK